MESADRNALGRQMAFRRPSNRVLIAHASGSRAGSMIGTDQDAFELGPTESCLVKTECTNVHDSQLRIERRDQGWFAIPLDGAVVFHGQTLSTSDFQLRSGDLIRIGLDGNDFQFCLQTPGHSIQSVIAKHLPQSRLAEDEISSQEGAAVPTRTTDAISDAVTAAANQHAGQENIGRQTTLVDASNLPNQNVHRESSFTRFSSLKKTGTPMIWLIAAVVVSFLILLGALALLVFAFLFRSGAS